MMIKRIRVLLWGLALVSLAVPLLSFVCISWFNFPYADDYDWSNQAREFGSFGVVWHSYFAWHGRYFSTLLLGFNPLVFGWMRGYAFLPVLLILGLILLGAVRLRSWMNLKGSGAVILSIAVFLLWMLSIPNPTEAIYWMSGSLTYTVPIILAFLFWQIEGDSSIGRNLKIIVCAILCFCIVGSNETIMLCFTGFVFALFVFSLVEENEPARIDLLLFSIVCLIGAAIVIKAPGNAVRLAHFEHNNDFAHSLGTSIRMSYDIIFFYLSSLPFWLISVFILLLDFDSHTSSTASKTKEKRLLFILALGLVLMLMSIFPAVWSTGAAPPRRTVNTTHVIFLLNWLFLMRWLRLRLREIDFYSDNRFLEIRSLLLPFSVFVTGLFFANHHVVQDIFADFESGRVWRYQSQVKERAELVENSLLSHQNEVLTLPLIVEPPQIVFSTDLKNDPCDWINEGFAKFYGLQGVRSIANDDVKLKIDFDEN